MMRIDNTNGLFCNHADRHFFKSNCNIEYLEIKTTTYQIHHSYTYQGEKRRVRLII